MKKLFPILLLSVLGAVSIPAGRAADSRPNILFAIADDWGWPHAGAYGDPVVRTPTFDQIARDGILFQHAYISSPSCTPSRNAILTGQYHWRLGTGGNLWSTLDTKHRTYPLMLEEKGYFVGHWRKAWGPGKLDNWNGVNPAGKTFKNLDAFLEARPKDQPFCFWFGASDPHRPYREGTGRESGMDLSKIDLFEHYPDSEVIRSDVADYYWEVQRFDRELGEALDKLEQAGLLDNTLVMVTGDHGMPFPRCKGNLYDSGARVPLAAMWKGVIHPGRVIDDFVSTTDLAPTFMAAADLSPLAVMTGRSLMPMFRAGSSGRFDPVRDHVLTGKERHVAAQEAPDSGGTPMRAIRTHDYLLIRNYRPDRWPAGTPNYEEAFLPGSWFGDCDNGPAKTYMVDNRDQDPEHRRKYQLAFGKRPEFELYDLNKDPGQVNNVAGKQDYAEVLSRLLARMESELKASEDPRMIGLGHETFDLPPYYGGAPTHPDYRDPAKAKKAPGKGKGRK